MTSDLYGQPELYDALFQVRAHVPYYMGLGRRAAGEVLELACGTGQLTLPIAAAGMPVTGIDISEPMLTVARKRGAAAGVSIEYRLGDMRKFDLDRQFALIFIARNSLLHLHSIEDILSTFAAVRRHLAPGGLFAFDIFNPSVQILARPPAQRSPMMQVETDLFGKLSVEGTNDYDCATQVSRDILYVSTQEKPDAWVLPLTLRSIFPQELPLLLQAAGFHLKSRAGDLHEAPFSSTSRLQVCICAPST